MKSRTSHNVHAEHIKKHASKRLRANLRILAIVSAVLFLVTIYSVVKSNAIFWQVVLAIIIGLAAGVISARMYKITWSKDEAKVVGRMDIYGIIVVILFALFEINRSYIAGLFVNGQSLGAISLVLLTSALFGRVIGTGRTIIKTLYSEKIIS